MVRAPEVGPGGLEPFISDRGVVRIEPDGAGAFRVTIAASFAGGRPVDVYAVYSGVALPTVHPGVDMAEVDGAVTSRLVVDVLADRSGLVHVYPTAGQVLAAAQADWSPDD